MSQPFSGLTAAPFTPFHSEGSLNLAVIPEYARFLQRAGVRAAFVCGTTGEGASLSLDERRQVAEAWSREATPDFRIIVHVGHTALPEARALAAHAAGLPVAAISLLAPYFFKPRNAGELVDWCREVAAAAPQLPFYYYHIPSLTGVAVPVAKFLGLAVDDIPSLAGVKYTHDDLADFAACLNFRGGRFDVLFGRDELLLEGTELGACGAVGSTYNYAAPLYLRLWEAQRAGAAAEARRLQDLAIQMIGLCNGVGVTHLAASKAIMGMLGVDCGPVRLPLAQPDVGQLAQLRGELDAIGFFEFCQP